MFAVKCLYAVNCLYSVKCLYAVNCQYAVKCLYAVNCQYAANCLYAVKCLYAIKFLYTVYGHTVYQIKDLTQPGEHCKYEIYIVDNWIIFAECKTSSIEPVRCTLELC